VTQVSKNRNLILESAKELFSSRSFDQVTIREICEHARVANSTFYYHFKTKEDLLFALRAQDEPPLRAELLSAMINPSLLEQIIAVCMIRAVRAEHHGYSITGQYYKEVIGREDGCCELDEEHRQEDEMICALIDRAQQEKLIHHETPAEVLAAAAARLTRCVIFDWCACSAGFDLCTEVRRMLLALLGVREG